MGPAILGGIIAIFGSEIDILWKKEYRIVKLDDDGFEVHEKNIVNRWSNRWGRKFKSVEKAKKFIEDKQFVADENVIFTSKTKIDWDAVEGK